MNGGNKTDENEEEKRSVEISREFLNKTPTTLERIEQKMDEMMSGIMIKIN